MQPLKNYILKKLEYNLNLKGNNIAIITTSSSITDEGTAKAMVNDLKIKGFKCDYIYLPENSNFKDKVYQVFIGPYENIEETNQWAKNLNLEFNIITL
jgi:ABC-type branched-subunit amino acid transport system substrate-binding protein